MKKGFLILVLFFCACATKVYRIADQNLSLMDIKKAVTNVIGDPRVLSENQRTYISQYYSRKSDPRFDPNKSRERAYSKVVILGDRRPYDIEVEVFIEIKEGKEYLLLGNDNSEAKKLGKELRSKLNQSREDRNIIDDFRAF